MSSKTLGSVLISMSDEAVLRSYLVARRDDLTEQTLTDLEDQANQLRLEDPRQALHIAWVLQVIADVREDERRGASALRLKANALMQLGNYEESLTCYAAAREIRERYGEQLEIARLQVGWTAALKELARYDEALQLALPTREILLEHQKWDWLGNLELNIGSIYRLTDRYEEASQIYQHCRAHFLQAGNPVGAAQALVNAAVAMSCQDRFRGALKLLQEARPVFEEHGKRFPLAQTDLNLAILAFWMGHYQEAWETFNRTREEFKQLDDEMEIAVVDLYCSQVYLTLNLFPEALALTRQARPVFTRLDMKRHVALTDFMEATARRGLGESQEALRLLQQARSFFTDHSEFTWAALTDLERITLLREAGQPAEALSLAEETVALCSSYDLAYRKAHAQLLMAECRYDLGQLDQAQALYQEILEIPYAQCLPAITYRAYFGLGLIEEKRNQREEAHRHYRAAVAVIEDMRHSLRMDEFKAGLLDDKLAVYQAAVRSSLEMGQVEEALDYVERAKSSALLDLLVRNLELREEAGEATNPETWDRLRKLKEEWLWHYSKLEGPSVQGKEDAPRAEASGSGPWEALKRVEAQMGETLRELQSHKYNWLIQNRGPTGEEVRHYLSEDTLLIEYYCLGDKLLAFLIDSTGIVAHHEFSDSLEDIQRSTGVLEIVLKDVSGLEAEYIEKILSPLAQRHLKRLYEALVAPLATYMSGHRKLVIIPDDFLYYLPFHALYDGERYLIDQYEVQYAPSARVWGFCCQTRVAKKSPKKSQPALIIGYSDDHRLPYVSDEVEAIAAILPNPLLLQENEATLVHLREHAPHCRLIHIASHGVFRGDNPLFSFIKLADEPLNVIDVYYLDLSAWLVTLSACDTGISRIKGGDLFGLARGYLHAGVPSLVASSWKVDDASTAILMVEFYRRLEAGETIASALRAAQQELRRTKDTSSGKECYPYSHPHYWAPFFLIGADGGL